MEKNTPEIARDFFRSSFGRSTTNLLIAAAPVLIGLTITEMAITDIDKTTTQKSEQIMKTSISRIQEFKETAAKIQSMKEAIPHQQGAEAIEALISKKKIQEQTLTQNTTAFRNELLSNPSLTEKDYANINDEYYFKPKLPTSLVDGDLNECRAINNNGETIFQCMSDKDPKNILIATGSSVLLANVLLFIFGIEGKINVPTRIANHLDKRIRKKSH